MDPFTHKDERFSHATVAALIEAVATVYSHGELDVLFIHLGCEGVDEFEDGAKGNKLQRVSRVASALRRRDDPGSDLLELAKQLIEDRFNGDVEGMDGEIRPPLRKVIASLRADGFEVVDGRLVRTTPEPAPMAEQLSLLESELDARGLEVSSRHYRQAVDNHRNGNLEASNGQLRSFLENLLIETAQQTTGKRITDPKGAVDRLRNAGFLDGDEASLLKGLAGISNKRGAHHGLTDEEEALFRLHFSTAAARYLLAVVPPP